MKVSNVFFSCFCCCCSLSDSFLDNGIGRDEPEFEEDIRNVTVPAGREAILSCVVRNLGKYKVSMHLVLLFTQSRQRVKCNIMAKFNGVVVLVL